MNKQIIIGFSTTDKLISRFIRWITRSKISHAWISYYDKTLNQRMVMQAELWGFETRPLNRWARQNRFVAGYLLDDSKIVKNAVKLMAKHLGEDYDFKSAIRLGLSRWFTQLRKCFYRSPSRMMCSESVARFMMEAKLLPADFDPETASPSQLWEIVKKLKLEQLDDLSCFLS